MAAIMTKGYTQALTGSGSADGKLDVADTDGTAFAPGYKVGAKAWLRGSAGTPAPQLVMIDKIISATQVQVIFLPEGINDVKLRQGIVKYPSTQHNDCTAFGAGSTLTQYVQVVGIPPTVPAF